VNPRIRGPVLAVLLAIAAAAGLTACGNPSGRDDRTASVNDKAAGNLAERVEKNDPKDPNLTLLKALLGADYKAASYGVPPRGSDSDRYGPMSFTHCQQPAESPDCPPTFDRPTIWVNLTGKPTEEGTMGSGGRRFSFATDEITVDAYGLRDGKLGNRPATRPLDLRYICTTAQDGLTSDSLTGLPAAIRATDEYRSARGLSHRTTIGKFTVPVDGHVFTCILHKQPSN
jgi:hypothetical protein